MKTSSPPWYSQPKLVLSRPENNQDSKSNTSSIARSFLKFTVLKQKEKYLAFPKYTMLSC